MKAASQAPWVAGCGCGNMGHPGHAPGLGNPHAGWGEGSSSSMADLHPSSLLHSWPGRESDLHTQLQAPPSVAALCGVGLGVIYAPPP